MTRGIVTHVVAACLLFVSSPALAGIGYDDAVHESDIHVEVWTNRGDEAVYRDGETVELYYRTSRDAYVVAVLVETDGAVHLLHPYGSGAPERARAGVVYAIDAPALRVRGSEGIAYIQVLACREPMGHRMPDWLRPGYHHAYLPPGHWSWSEDRILRRYGLVVGDPFMGLASLRALIIPSWCGPASFGFGTATFCINRPHYYPRYICSDCHYSGWYDPYADMCMVFDIRMDPWWRDCYRPHRCYPRYVYWKRSSAPVRYRHTKTRWSSKDGRQNLVRHFGGRGGRDRPLPDDRVVSRRDRKPDDRVVSRRDRRPHDRDVERVQTRDRNDRRPPPAERRVIRTEKRTRPTESNRKRDTSTKPTKPSRKR